MFNNFILCPLLKKNLIFWIFFLISFSITAQDNIKIRFEHYDTQNGLMTNHVNDIFQDSTGYMWFCSKDGAFRFDGYKFKHFRHQENDSTSLTSNDIKCGFVDSKSRIWLGTDYGLELFNTKTETFTNFCDTMSWNRLVMDIEEAENGKLWLGTWWGLVLYDPATQTAKKYYFPEKEPEGITGFHSTRTIYQDSKQRLWLCTWAGGLRVFDTKTRKYVAWYKHDPGNPKTLASNDVRNVREDEKGNIWVAVWDGGLHLLEPETGTFKKFTFFPKQKHRSYNQINDLLIDSEGNFWLTTQKGLILFNRQTLNYHFFEQNSRLYHGYKGIVSQTIIEDNHQGIWIAVTQVPINYFNLKSLKFNTYQYEVRHPNSPAGTIIRNIEPHPNGMLYISYLNEIDRFNPETSQFRQIEFKPVKSEANFGKMTIDRNGYMWLSADNLYRINLETGKSTYFTPKDLHQKEINPKVKDIKVDQHNNLWLKYEKQIILKTAGKSNFIVLVFKDRIHNFFPFAKNSLWYTDGTLKQLIIKDSSFYLHDTIMKVENHPGLEIKNHNIKGNILQSDDKGNIYIIDSGKQLLIIYNIQNGDSSNYFIPFNDKHIEISCFLKEDKHPKFWLGTNTGLFSFDITNKELLHFTKADGLLEMQILGGTHTKQNDRMFFAGPHSFFGFKPENISKNNYKAPVVFSEIKIFNQSIEQKTKIPVNQLSDIELKHNQNSLTFEFAVLNFFNPQKNRYQCQLVGFDDDWIELGKENKAVYANLEPGNYQFKVRGCNNDRVWSKQTKKLNIEIQPPWWKTQWAQLMYIGLFIGLFILARKILLIKVNYQKQLEIERMQFNTRHEMLKKENELEQEKMKFFMDISHEFRTPLTLILGPLKRLIDKSPAQNPDYEQLNLIQRNALRLQRLINQLLDLRKLESGKMRLNITHVNAKTFIFTIFNSFQYLADRQKIKYELQIKNEAQSAYLDTDKVEKILYNLLSNAFKYTPDGGKISLRAEIKNNRLEIEVFNSGAVINPDKLQQIFDRFFRIENQDIRKQSGTGIGLALTKELTDLHQGEVSVHTITNKGNIFKIVLPVSKSAYKAETYSKPPASQQDKYPHVSQSFKDKQAVVASDKKGRDTGTGKYILLVIDDNPDIRAFIRTNVSNDFKTIEAANGLEAQQQIFKYIPDLIISDIMMPKMDGIALSKIIKSDPRTSHIPFILLTVHTSTEHQMQGYESGADDYITKPFNIDTLSAKISNILRTRSLLQKQITTRLGLTEDIPVENPIDKSYLENLVTITMKNLSDLDFGIDQLCRESAMSKSNLYRKLKALTGQTAADFIRNIRLNYAAQLIKNTPQTFSEIAVKSGFKDVSYFRTSFKKKFGQTATEYRDSNLTN